MREDLIRELEQEYAEQRIRNEARQTVFQQHLQQDIMAMGGLEGEQP